jgi:hypothetical protein
VRELIQMTAFGKSSRWLTVNMKTGAYLGGRKIEEYRPTP